MNSMYSNRITITMNESEAFLKFDCLAPEYGENNEPKGQTVRESQEIIVDIKTLKRIRDLFNEILEAKEEGK